MAMMKFGVAPLLEAEANRIIRESLKGVTKHSDKSDILTPWKETERRRREIYSRDGIPDPSNRRGMFHRAPNPARPDLMSRDGIASAASRRGFRGSLSSFVDEHGVDRD